MGIFPFRVVEWVEALDVVEGVLVGEEVDLGQVEAEEEEEEEAWVVLMMKTSSLCQQTNVAWLLEKVEKQSDRSINSQAPTLNCRETQVQILMRRCLLSVGTHNKFNRLFR